MVLEDGRSRCRRICRTGLRSQPTAVDFARLFLNEIAALRLGGRARHLRLLLVTAGIRATPGLLMVPLETEFGWSRAASRRSRDQHRALRSDRAVRRLGDGSLGNAAPDSRRWGCLPFCRVVHADAHRVAPDVVLGRVRRRRHRRHVDGARGRSSPLAGSMSAAGVVLGALSAANATGQLVFLPLLAGVVEHTAGGRPRWSSRAPPRSCSRSSAVHARSAGGPRAAAVRPAAGRRTDRARRAGATCRTCARVRSRAFWILAGTFFVCGASTNGLIGTHLIAACHDYGIPQMRSAQLLALMGIFDILGTTASGWLTDRYSSRHLLFGYYTLRGRVAAFCRSTLASGGAVSAGSRCSTGSTGSRPCRRRCG